MASRATIVFPTHRSHKIINKFRQWTLGLFRDRIRWSFGEFIFGRNNTVPQPQVQDFAGEVNIDITAKSMFELRVMPRGVRASLVREVGSAVDCPRKDRKPGKRKRPNGFGFTRH